MQFFMKIFREHVARSRPVDRVLFNPPEPVQSKQPPFLLIPVQLVKNLDFPGPDTAVRRLFSQNRSRKVMVSADIRSRIHPAVNKPFRRLVNRILHIDHAEQSVLIREEPAEIEQGERLGVEHRHYLVNIDIKSLLFGPVNID